MTSAGTAIILVALLAAAGTLCAPRPARAAAGGGPQETMTSQDPKSADTQGPARSPDELIRQGEACLENGDASKARDLFEAALQMRPDDARAMLGLGRALTARRRYVEADALYRDMEERHIESIQARLGRARIRSLRGDHQGARQFYKDALQADPGNLAARLGLVSEAHAMGLDRAALPQADNLVLDHPESAEARALSKRIHDDLAPRLEIEPSHQQDDGGNRVDEVTAAGSFMAEPQTEVRIALTGVRTRSDCGDAIDCTTMVDPPQVDGTVQTDSRVLVAGVRSRLVRPLTFEARMGAAQEEPLDGSRRTLLLGDGLLRWDVGPRFAVQGTTGRRPLMDSVPLVDWGIRLDTGVLRVEWRPRPEWTVTGWGDLGWYSDGNVRETLAAGAAYHATITHPEITAGFEARLRRFRDDRDFGYLDPIRYDSEILTVTLSDAIWDGRFYWSFGGSVGRQAYDPNYSERAPVAEPEETVHGAAARAGVVLGDRVRVELSHVNTNDAMYTDPGFPVRRTGLILRVRL